MTWTIEEIEKDWLAGGRIAVSPEDVVATFERCERVLGRDWIYARRAEELAPAQRSLSSPGSDWKAWAASPTPATLSRNSVAVTVLPVLSCTRSTFCGVGGL